MQTEDRTEPFSTVADLCDEFGYATVIQSLTILLEFEVKADPCCVTCERKAMWMEQELRWLWNRYQNEFPLAARWLGLIIPAQRSLSERLISVCPGWSVVRG